MAFRDSDPTRKALPPFEPEEGWVDPISFMQRIRAGEGLPIVKLDQLIAETPRGDEAIFVRTQYDRFAQGQGRPRGD